jgi:hypothetical protein
VRRIVSALWLALCCVTLAQAAEETWFSVHLDGRKIGHMRTARVPEANGVVRHEQDLELRVERNGDALRIATAERSWETAAGEPLRFETEVDTAGSLATLRGELRAGEVHVESEQQGRRSRQTLAWPSGALLPEGQRLAAERAGFAPGTQYEVQAFDPGSLQAFPVRTRVGNLVPIDVHGREERLIVLQQTLRMGGIATETSAWIDPGTRALRRLRMPAIGLVLEMLACDRDCALAPVQPTDVLASIIVPAPRMLAPRQLQRPLDYRLRLARGDGAALDAVPGQHLERLGGAGEYSLLVKPGGEAGMPPQAEDLASNRWLQADDPAVVALAREAARGARGARAQVEQLERFVRGYIRTKSLRVGYASAREIMQGREGDCTEHAVLLASLVRALGIPARVATGIAYAPAFGERRDVFVPHAWVLAWVDGEWRGFDAALPRFGAGHIAFSVGDGDPFRFYGGIELLGSVEVLGIERASAQRVAQAKR